MLVPTIKCMICDSDIKVGGMGSHLKNHNINTKKYLETDEYALQYKLDNEIASEYKKQRTPWCIEYYVKKYGIDDSEKEFEKAKKERNSKGAATAKENFKKMTEEDKAIRKKKKRATTISNLMLAHNCSEDEAEIYYSQSKKNGKNSLPYWMKKGFTEKEAITKISEYQKTVSPRCIQYWEKQGFTKQESLDKISIIQDNRSVDYYRRNGLYDLEIIDMKITKYTENFNDEIEKYGSLDSYYIELGKRTRYMSDVAFYTTLSIDIHNLKFDTIDHIISKKYGYDNNIPAEIIGSELNLQSLTMSENSTKNHKVNTKDVEKIIEAYNDKIKL